MKSEQAYDLAQGVRLVPLLDGGWQVRSERLRLPWAARAGRVAGSCVVWCGENFEVVQKQRFGAGDLWILRPWPENEVMRGVFGLGSETIADLAATSDSVRQNRRARIATLPVLPILGLAPAPRQRTWEKEWGFPPILATATSAVGEIAIGALGVVQSLAAGIGGAVFLPPFLLWLTVVGPVLMVVGLVRLVSALGHGEPLGSPLGMFWLFLPDRDQSVPAVDPGPEIRSYDDGVRLVVWSPIHRVDWSADGILGYRGQAFELTRCALDSGGWRYEFDAAETGISGPLLRLAPPRQKSSEGHEPPPNVLRSTLTSVLACLGPADLQRIWADRLGVRATWLTLVGGSAELLGGMTNLRAAGDGVGPLAVSLNLVLLVEGLSRLVLLAVQRQPVGSLIGPLLRPLINLLLASKKERGR